MGEQKCPDCNGKLYVTMHKGTPEVKVCYKCGYYENDTPQYKETPKLIKELFKREFVKSVKWRPVNKF